jgi:hypothetical protein
MGGRCIFKNPSPKGDARGSHYRKIVPYFQFFLKSISNWLCIIQKKNTGAQSGAARAMQIQEPATALRDTSRLQGYQALQLPISTSPGSQQGTSCSSFSSRHRRAPLPRRRLGTLNSPLQRRPPPPPRFLAVLIAWNWFAGRCGWLQGGGCGRGCCDWLGRCRVLRPCPCWSEYAR